MALGKKPLIQLLGFSFSDSGIFSQWDLKLIILLLVTGPLPYFLLPLIVTKGIISFLPLQTYHLWHRANGYLGCAS